MKQLYLLLGFCCLIGYSQPTATTSKEQVDALEAKTKLEAQSLVKHVPFTNIGPTVMSGRVVDIAVNPSDPTEFYVAYASGGLWYTNNNGTSFTPVMDQTSTQNLGDIAVDWKQGTIWVGTGENNASRSSYAGIGMLKSTDHGKTWENMGLPDSHHIGRILINPKNVDEVVVGVTGHLYSPNNERGMYKTTDGGKTWKKTLFIDAQTGIIDVAMAPNNFEVLYAAAWQKDRKAWNFSGNGKGSAIYKSTDAGNTWTKISTKESGFPTGEGVGRIGLAVFDQNTIYAVHDNQYRRPAKEKKNSKSDALQKDDFKSMTTSQLLALEDKKLNTYLKTNGFQEKYRAANVKQMIRDGVVKPADLATYLENANALLFDTPVIGAEVYKSIDGGKTWNKTHEGSIEDLFYSYGYYFAQIAIDPNNADQLYIAGVPLLASADGGKAWENISKENVHADHHSIWVNPKKEGHIINGNDGGVNITYDNGAHWIKNNTPSVGQFYAINVDNQEPYNVYGGLQDNGVWVGAHNAQENSAWHQSGQYPWESIMGGDGMQVQIDNRDPNIVYTGYQFGNYYRINRKTGKNTYIQPKHQLGEAPYRFNWQTPILLSKHNQDILYLGSNKLHRSLDQGNTWEAISEDLTQGGKKGNVAYGTITTISESTFKFGHIYIGTDDGYIQRTTDGGGSWENISGNLPTDMWVSRVQASTHKKDRVYAALNGYRWDNFTAYVYRSEDGGKNWKSISNNLPNSPVNVIIEDPVHADLLFVGTDNGAYASFDGGNSWQAFAKGLPNVAVHDMVIQPKAKDLLIGTHGRSIYKTNIAAMQQMNADVMQKDLAVFEIAATQKSRRWGASWTKWMEAYDPKATITFYSKTATTTHWELKNDQDVVVNRGTIDANKGIQSFDLGYTFSEAGKKAYMKKNKKAKLNPAANGKHYLPKGIYQLVLKQGKAKAKQTMEVK